MSTIVVGRGHLGRYIAARLGLALYPGRLEDIDAPDGLTLVNCAGRTDLPYCEANMADAVRVNTVYPVLLYERLARTGGRLIHLGSGCVFAGPYRDDGRPFEPDDPVSPACIYSSTKAECDAILMNEARGARDVAILRLRMPYSPVRSPRNLLTKLGTYAGLIDTPNSIASADTLVRTVDALLRDNDSPLWGRISCVYDLGITTPYRIGCMLADAGLRTQPDRLDKAAMDAWHRPQRVDTVLHDGLFETAVSPPPVEVELARVIGLYAATGEPGRPDEAALAPGGAAR